ncbi:MAG: hypothetical protein IJO64_01210 [Clostridia bacterium]|nr:hypothetical protein [Clostridia bacterium]
MKKFLVCILALVLLVPFLAACQDDTTESTSSEEVSEEVSKITVPVKDMEGREFRILCWDFASGSILGYTGEVMYAEENPSSVDEAKKIVVDYVESAYNCTIVGEKTNTDPIPTTIRNQVTSGMPYYDICFDSISSSTPLATEKQIMDLTEISTIDLSAPWWDQNAVADLSIGNRVYFTCGDINTYDDQGTWCVLFNKTLKNTLGIEEDFYQLVRDDKWTFDKLVEICSNGITADITGDNVIDEFDRWAFGTETYNLYVHLVAAGQKIAGKDDNDLPYLVAEQEPEATYTILSDAIEFYNDNSTVMVANAPPYSNKYTGTNPNVWEATVHKAFIEGRELFYMCGLIHAASFRVMDDEFGILPVPKYYETQERYYHTVSQGNSTIMYIPVGAENVDDIGLIVSALGEQSKNYVTPAYYDIQLKYRDSRDDESGEMLDLIFASRTFDLGAAFNWGSLLGQYTQLDTNIASRFEANLSSAQTAMDQMIEDLDK